MTPAADVVSPARRSEIMARIRSCGNKTTELCFMAIARKRHITGWRRGITLPGKPDFVFPRERVALFIDGDFWHGNPRKYRLPTSNKSYWRKKIERNRRRDKIVNRTLKSMGWRVLRLWESALRNEDAVAVRIRLALRTRA